MKILILYWLHIAHFQVILLRKQKEQTEKMAM